MSKQDLVAHVAEAGGVPITEARRMVDLVLGEIENGVKRARIDGKFSIGSFGTFTIAKRPARAGRNPRTGEEIEIKAGASLRFKPASQLKDAAGC